MLGAAQNHPAEGLFPLSRITASADMLEQNRFVNEVRRVSLPSRKDEGYAEALRALHSNILGICSLVESFPYSVEPWMPPLTESEPCAGKFGIYCAG